MRIIRNYKLYRSNTRYTQNWYIDQSNDNKKTKTIQEVEYYNNTIKACGM